MDPSLLPRQPPAAPEALVARRVAELQLDARPGRELQRSAVEFDARGGLGRPGLRDPRVAPQQRRLAHRRVPQQRDAELVAAAPGVHGSSALAGSLLPAQSQSPGSPRQVTRRLRRVQHRPQGWAGGKSLPPCSPL
jgi:hypothetical protein